MSREVIGMEDRERNGVRGVGSVLRPESCVAGTEGDEATGVTESPVSRSAMQGRLVSGWEPQRLGREGTLCQRTLRVRRLIKRS